jgi:hypothetical protein
MTQPSLYLRNNDRKNDKMSEAGEATEAAQQPSVDGDGFTTVVSAANKKRARQQELQATKEAKQQAEKIAEENSKRQEDARQAEKNRLWKLEYAERERVRLEMEEAEWERKKFRLLDLPAGLSN